MSPSRRPRRLALLVLAGLLVVAAPVQAAQTRRPITWGAWKLWTEWSLDLQLRGNLHLAPTHDITKALYILRPALHLRRDFHQASYLCLDYQAMVAVKEDSSPLVDNFANDDWWSNSLGLSLRLGGFTGYYLRAEGVFQRTSDRRGSDNLFRLGLKTSRRFSRLRAVVGYGFGLASRLELGLGYGHREYDAPEADKQNQRSYQAGLTFLRRLGRGRWALVRYRLEHRDYLDQDDFMQQDYFQHSIMAGVRFMPGGRLSGVAQVGVAWRHFRDPVNEAGVALESGADWVARVFLDFRPDQATLLRLDFTRGLLTAPSCGLDYNYLTANRLTAELRRRLWPGVELFAAVAVGRWDYNPLDPAARGHDHFFEAGLGFSCQLANGALVRASWGLDHRAAGDPGMSYCDQRYTLSLGWRR